VQQLCCCLELPWDALDYEFGSSLQLCWAAESVADAMGITYSSIPAEQLRRDTCCGWSTSLSANRGLACSTEGH